MENMPKIKLEEKYPPSQPCNCDICLAYCRRPGWWTVMQAKLALQEGYGGRMMLEISPEQTFAVLSPAFNGCEGGFAMQSAADKGCNFLQPDRKCELHTSHHLPLECAFCHHERIGQGKHCHTDLEEDWQSPQGKALVKNWCRQMGWWDLLESFGLEWLKK
jgi:hypothetical protein